MRRLLAGMATALLLALAGAAPAAALEVWAVGDGGDTGTNDDQVGSYIGSRSPELFLYLGDVYPGPGQSEGSMSVFQNNYGPAFGAFLAFTHPTPGNHEWGNHVNGYDPYFGARAPQTGGGHWYSFNAGGWHFVSLNTEEPIGEGSPQLEWLRADLDAQPGDCTIAFMHKPRFSDGFFKGTYETELAPLWGALSGRAVAALAAHDHNYQRFKPVGGVTQIIAGTGGHGLHAVTPSSRLATSTSYTDTQYGALRLAVTPARADFEFVTTAGAQLDSGTLACTGPVADAEPQPPPPPPQDTTPPPPPPPPSPVAPGPSVTPVHDDDPVVLIRRPRSGSVQRRGVRLFAGTAAHVKGPVRITITRGARKRCRALGARGFRYSCTKRVPWWRAKGVSRWSLRLPASRALQKGRYRLVVATAPASDVATFRVR